MQFFLDTASVEEIRHYKELGLVDGVTINPNILARELEGKGKDPIDHYKEVASIVSGPVSAEVTYTEPEKMVRQARKLAKLADNIIIKIPASPAGLAAACQLKKDGIKMNITLNFHASQAIPFFQLGVDYLSIFVAHVEDFGLNNKKLVYEARQIITQMKSSTKLIAASMRNPDYLVEAIMAGPDVVTVPPICWEKVFKNPIFSYVENDFLTSWKTRLPEKIRKAYESID